MTIEQEFFDAFGVEKIQKCRYLKHCDMCFNNEPSTCNNSDNLIYPPITPEIVLGLVEKIMLLQDDYNFSVERFDNEARFLFCDKRIILANEDNLKNCILQTCIQLKHELQAEVQELFRKN